MLRALWCLVAAAALGGCSGGEPRAASLEKAAWPRVPDRAVAAAAPGAGDRVEVPPPPFSEGVFPCSGCHAGMPTDRARRELSMHSEIALSHDEEHRWCLDCHDADDRDWLHLASGERVSFEQSYLLCGQCHGEKLRDWRAGVHGRRSGEWNGRRTYLLCAHCHDPHEPRFKPIPPMPGPRRPGSAGVPARQSR